MQLFALVQAAVAGASAAPSNLEAAPQELAVAPSPMQAPRPAPKITSMAATDLLTRKLLPTAPRNAGVSSLAAARAKPTSGPHPSHREREPKKVHFENSLARDNAPSSSLPIAAERPELRHQPPEADRAAGASASRSGPVPSSGQFPPRGSGGERQRAGEVTREGGFCSSGSGSTRGGAVAELSRRTAEEARPPDVRTQAQRDRDFNRAVLATAERQSVSAFEHLDLPTPQVCPAGACACVPA